MAEVKQDLLWPGDTPREREAFKHAIADSIRRATEADVALARTMRRGGKPGRQLALGRVIEPWLKRRPDLTVDEVFNELDELAALSPDHPVVKEVLQLQRSKDCRKLKCTKGYHVHWMSNSGRLRTTGFRALRNLVSGILVKHRTR